jgi:hypothetical protein
MLFVASFEMNHDPAKSACRQRRNVAHVCFALPAGR